MLDRFADLRTFVTVAQGGGFAAVTDRLGIVKSVVSLRIRELEERLEVRLMHRTTRQISLTDAGHAYFERAAEIRASLEALDDAARSDSHKPACKLKRSQHTIRTRRSSNSRGPRSKPRRRWLGRTVRSCAR
ncbi:LysR family transcriptional regulator [Sphingomonas paucimobilis]|uniref:LysR family transcriptional regulator n=1 Tax=Sphingomonas paucimobilis TaxID=13689 RepID=UPI0036F3D4B8